MLISALLILLVASGGLPISYFLDDDEPFLWRVSAGVIVGSVVFGTASFVLACFVGLGIATFASLALTLSPLILFRNKKRWRRFRTDWQRAKDKMQGGSWAKFLRFAFYAFFFILFCLVFSQAMYQTPAGIFTGGSQNGGDLPFHLGAIFSFTDAANFPPQNPSFAGAKFSYPFVADIVTASFMKLGADVRGALIVQDIAWAFSLLVIFERFVFRLTSDRVASKVAPWLLFFSGGLGFVWFFGDYWSQGKGLFELLNDLPKDYTIGDEFRWGNSITTLFLTQRSLLLGMPLTMIIFQWLWDHFDVNSERAMETGDHHKKGLFERGSFVPLLIGLLAGTLPLVHLHSLVVLFVVTVFLFGLNPENWKTWIAFGVGVCVIAVPELIWSVVGSASHPSQFIDWHFGWATGDLNIFWFWFKNTGLTIALVAVGFYLVYGMRSDGQPKVDRRRLMAFASPFIFLFIVANVAKLAPWEWDNIKVLIYCFVGALPFAALALSWLWSKGRYVSAAAGFIFLTLVISGGLDIWRTVSGQVKFLLFDQDAVRVADLIKSRTAPRALFLNAATYNSAVALTGRQSLMRYPGHLFSYGIDYAEREADVRKMYQGGPAADALLARYGIDYVLVSREESSLSPNTAYFEKFPVVAEAGSAKVYKVK
jgi:hypothetical protein